MAWSHSQLSTESGSDLEQAAPLITKKQAASLRLALCMGVLVAATCVVGLAPRLLGAEQARAPYKAVRLSGTMQAYAMERMGRTLTGSEVEVLYSHMAGDRHPKARALMDRFAMSDGLLERKQGQQELELSQVCVDAIHDKLQEALKSFAKLLIEAFFGCVLGDEESAACVMATEKMDHFLDDMVAKCQAEGDACNITAVGEEQGKLVQESAATCVPELCHGEAKRAIEYFQEKLGEQVAEAQARAQAVSGERREAVESSQDCANCTIGIVCATVHGAGDMGGATLSVQVKKRK